MKKKLQKRFILYTLLIFLIADLILIGVSIFFTNYYKSKLFEELKKDLVHHINESIVDFNQLIYENEQSINNLNEKALLGIASAIDKKLDRNLKISSEFLKNLAKKHKISEIYVVDENGVIQSTTFSPDENFNLFKISEQFGNYLKGIYGKGIFHQPLTISTLTGIINKYSYYGVPGKKYIIEVSTTIKKYFDMRYTESFYQYFFKRIFKNSFNTSAYLKSIDVYMNNGTDKLWSLLNEGKQFNDPKLIQAMKGSELVIWSDSSKFKLISVFQFKRSDREYQDPWILEADFDLSNIRKTLITSMKYILIFSCIAFLILLFIASRFFSRVISGRIDKIIHNIQLIEKGKYEEALKIYGKDEIQEIANSIDNMQKKIKEREEDILNSNQQIKKNLEYKEMLTNELRHRTYNNMQVIISIIIIKAMISKDPNVKDFLEDIVLRINALSIVQRELINSENLSRVNLKVFIHELFEMIYCNYNDKNYSIQFQFEIPDIEILIDYANPLGLVFFELFSNSLKHGFTKDKSGLIQLKILKSNEKGLLIHYSDNGVGLSENIELDQAESLGFMTIYKVIVEQLHGKISYQNQNGLSFFIEIEENLYQERI